MANKANHVKSIEAVQLTPMSKLCNIDYDVYLSFVDCNVCNTLQSNPFVIENTTPHHVLEKTQECQNYCVLQWCVSDKQGASIPILGPNTAVVIECVSTWAVKSG